MQPEPTDPKPMPADPMITIKVTRAGDFSIRTYVPGKGFNQRIVGSSDAMYDVIEETFPHKEAPRGE